MSTPASRPFVLRHASFRVILASIAALVLASTGCDRNIEPYQPGEEARAPDLARIFPDAGGGVGSIAGQAGEEEGGESPTRGSSRNFPNVPFVA